MTDVPGGVRRLREPRLLGRQMVSITLDRRQRIDELTACWQAYCGAGKRENCGGTYLYRRLASLLRYRAGNLTLPSYLPLNSSVGVVAYCHRFIASQAQ